MNALGKVETAAAISTLFSVVDLYKTIGVLDTQEALRMIRVLRSAAGRNAHGPDQGSGT